MQNASKFSFVFQDAQKVVEYLLQHNANPDLLCQGHSPLSLAICSGNDLVSIQLSKLKKALQMTKIED